MTVILKNYKEVPAGTTDMYLTRTKQVPWVSKLMHGCNMNCYEHRSVNSRTHRKLLAKLILELSFRVEDLNLMVFFVSAELFEWFLKIRESIYIRVVFRRP